MVAYRDWDETANPYETQRRLSLIFGSLLAATPLRDARLLDAGSGGGHFSAEAARRGARVISMDVGSALLAGVARRTRRECAVGSVLELPFPSHASSRASCGQGGPGG